MEDEDAREALDAKHDRNREQRLEGIKRWVEYIETHDPSDWGDQQNRLVDSQLESGRRSGIDADHRRRVERAGRDLSP
jgi:hypothetical protein